MQEGADFASSSKRPGLSLTKQGMQYRSLLRHWDTMIKHSSTSLPGGPEIRLHRDTYGCTQADSTQGLLAILASTAYLRVKPGVVKCRRCMICPSRALLPKKKQRGGRCCDYQGSCYRTLHTTSPPLVRRRAGQRDREPEREL